MRSPHRPVNNQGHRGFTGAYFEFHLMIEDAGHKNAIMDRFAIEITEFGINQERQSALIEKRDYAVYSGRLLSCVATIGSDTMSV